MSTRQSFDQIARDHGAMIKRIAASYETETSLAEDLVQDIYFAIWRALPSFRREASLRTFVARIAINRAVTHVGRALKLPPSLELSEQIPAPGASPERQAILVNRQARLMAAVRSLPLEGQTPNEIADFLGITANAVAIRMARAKELLRTRIGEKP